MLRLLGVSPVGELVRDYGPLRLQVRCALLVLERVAGGLWAVFLDQRCLALAQGLLGTSGHGQDAHAGCRLRRLEVPELVEGMAHHDGVVLEIDVLPGQPDALAPTKPQRRAEDYRALHAVCGVELADKLLGPS